MAENQMNSIQTIIEGLHACCTSSLVSSLNKEFNSINGASYSFCNDLDQWSAAFEGRQEKTLYSAAASEFALALLNNAQGQYRNAFKGLRLTLELILQGVYLSTNLIKLNEWLTSHADTSWLAIIDEENGVFSKRFIRAFFPELSGEVGTFAALSKTLYREMSECTHGNIPNRIPLPSDISFNKPIFELWHEKACTLKYIANFALTARYFTSLSKESKGMLSPIISDQLGSFTSIRVKLEESA